MGGWVAVECVGSVRDGQKDKGPESDLMFKAERIFACPALRDNYLTWIGNRSRESTTAVPHLGYNGLQRADLSPSTRQHEGEHLL
jgi:hypothetical protein